MSPKYGDIPLVLDKDLGRPQLPKPDVYCLSNSEGRPIVELSPAQKYAFDIRGWLLVPGVLSEEEMEPMREHIIRLHTTLGARSCQNPTCTVSQILKEDRSSS